MSASEFSVTNHSGFCHHAEEKDKLDNQKKDKNTLPNESISSHEKETFSCLINKTANSSSTRKLFEQKTSITITEKGIRSSKQLQPLAKTYCYSWTSENRTEQKKNRLRIDYHESVWFWSSCGKGNKKTLHYQIKASIFMKKHCV